MALWVSFSANGAGEPEVGTPEPDRLIAGAPSFRTWNAYESADGKTFCGIWVATPGTWRISYENGKAAPCFPGIRS
jgi:uncharacterized cupin superfamily protein